VEDATDATTAQVELTLEKYNEDKIAVEGVAGEVC
jgi:hypothetical protein